MAHEIFKNAIDDIYIYFLENTSWHRRIANQCRKLGIRGFGWWHEAELVEDEMDVKNLSKILMDNLKYATKITNITNIEKYENITMENLKDFKTHFEIWVERENYLIEKLNIAINEARTINIEIYEKLCKIQKMAQNEKMRVEWVLNNLMFAGMSGHDITVKSKWLHAYFEHEHKPGSKIDFNIG